MNTPIIISIGGGKGGVGKSILTSNLGALLAARGHTVGFIDGDLSGANLHLYVGVRRPSKGLQDFLQGTYNSLQDIVLETAIPNTWLMSGASDILQLANPKFTQKQKIISHIKKMDADFLLVDLGAGSDIQVSDFFSAFQHGITVCDSLPSSIENAYGFLKNGIIRGLTRLFPGEKSLQNKILSLTNSSLKGAAVTILEMITQIGQEEPEKAEKMESWLRSRKNFLVLNMVKERADIEVGDRFKEIVRRYLGINLIYIGYILASDDIRDSVRRCTPYVLERNETGLYNCFESITQNLCTLTIG